LVSTLDEFEVPKAEQEELLGLLAPMRGDIVQVESPESGHRCLRRYEIAPALR
jgi:hemoglobin